MPTPSRPKPPFDGSVFLNCPFDADYQPLFRAMVFVVEYCGFTARCALEADDSSETRAEKLLRIIRGSRFGIHDICRTESNAEGLPRFNMPYELGLFVGCKASGQPRQGRKSVLILDRERYRFQRFLSDIAGQDIRAHGGQPDALVREVRHWLIAQTGRDLPGAGHILERFRQFQADIPQLLVATRKTVEDLDNYHDFHRLVSDWIELYPSPG